MLPVMLVAHMLLVRFGKECESSFILIWDGGMYPRLYYFDSISKKIENFGPLFLLIGNTYTIFFSTLRPIHGKKRFCKGRTCQSLESHGLYRIGTREARNISVSQRNLSHGVRCSDGVCKCVGDQIEDRIKNSGFPDEDVLATFHLLLEDMLIEKLKKKISRIGRSKTMNLCIAGGCGLTHQVEQRDTRKWPLPRGLCPTFSKRFWKRNWDGVRDDDKSKQNGQSRLVRL